MCFGANTSGVGRPYQIVRSGNIIALATACNGDKAIIIAIDNRLLPGITTSLLWLSPRTVSTIRRYITNQSDSKALALSLILPRIFIKR